MENKIFLKLFSILILSLFFYGITHAGDILFHEEVGQQAVIYRLSPNGTGLRKIGKGLFPKWSPDGRYISYIGAGSRDTGEFIVADLKDKEIFRIKNIREMGGVVRYSWNPKGKSIAFVTVFGRHNGSVSIYDIKTKSIRILHDFGCRDLDEALMATTLEWSPDGEQLLFSSGSILSKGQGVVLINAKKGTVKRLSNEGALPRFTDRDRLLFVIGSEIWTTYTDGSNKRKLLDVGMLILNSSKAVNNKIILQLMEKGKREEVKLFLFDVKNIELEKLKAENYLLLCPKISYDGKKITAVGVKSKYGELDTSEEAEPGYYVFDLIKGEVTLLKRFEPGKSNGFWFGVYFGYGNHTSWK